MAAESPAPKQQRLLLVTGMSGAGKSTVLQVLEDLGWEAIDNFPVRLIKRLVSPDEDQAMPLAIGVDSRTRGFVPGELIAMIEKLDRRDGICIDTLFLDCSAAEIERRYNETRRRHPMARGRPVIEGVKAERELLEPLRSWAQMVIDTTAYSSDQVQQVVRERFADVASQELTVTVTSFGFARGMPPIADLVFDMRFLDNPHWVESLREQTGLDGPVGEHIERDPAFAPEFARISELVQSLLPRYEAQGRAYLTIAFGCTGGKHRSVYSAEKLGQILRDAGYTPTIIHRNLEARAADTVEQR